MSQRFYSDDEAEQILRLASHQVGGAGISHERLLQSAAELGISPEAVEQAAGKLLDEQKERDFQARYRKHALSEFLSHLGSYVVVNLFLAGINFVTDHKLSWVIWPILGWGLGIAMHAVTSLNPHSSCYQDSYRAWRRRQQLKSGETTVGDSDTDPSDEKDQHYRMVLGAHVRHLESVNSRRELKQALREARKSLRD